MVIDYNVKIGQTRRTMVIEQFSKEKPSLAKALERESEGLAGYEKLISDMNGKGEDGLLVKSFAEFLNRFEPCIYRYFFQDGDRISFFYSENPIERDLSGQVVHGLKMKLTEEPFYEAVREILNKKKRDEKANMDFDYRSVLEEYFSPEKEVERVKKIRAKVEDCDKRGREALALDHPNEAQRYFKMRNKQIGGVIEKYGDNPLSFLPLMIADIGKAIDLRGTKIIGMDNDNGEIDQRRIIPALGWKNGELIALNEGNEPTSDENHLVPKNTSGTLAMQGNKSKTDQEGKVNELWNQAADQMPMIQKNLSLRENFLAVFSKETSVSFFESTDVEELKDKQKKLVSTYKDMQQSYIETVSDLTRKILDVEMFFRHAGDEHGEIEEGVLIANCTVSELLEAENFSEFLSVYNEGLRDKGEMIWFAVLPSVAMDDEVHCSDGSIDPDKINFDDITFEGELDYSGEKGISIGEMNEICKILIGHRIIPFFNLNASPKTVARGFQEKDFANYRKYLKSTPGRAVVAYPNFHVLESDQGVFSIANNIEEEKLKLPDIFLDAAYVAAGSVVATQSKDSLIRHGYRKNDIIQENPCVRFDLNDYEASKHFETQINRESILLPRQEFMKRLREEGMGFFFGADSDCTNTAILQARTVSGQESGSPGFPLYQVLTENFLYHYIQETLKSYSEKDIKNKIDEIRKNVQIFNESSAVNLLLCPDKEESISWDGDMKKVMVRFKKTDLTIEVEVGRQDD